MFFSLSFSISCHSLSISSVVWLYYILSICDAMLMAHIGMRLGLWRSTNIKMGNRLCTHDTSYAIYLYLYNQMLVPNMFPSNTQTHTQKHFHLYIAEIYGIGDEYILDIYARPQNDCNERNIRVARGIQQKKKKKKTSPFYTHTAAAAKLIRSFSSHW